MLNTSKSTSVIFHVPFSKYFLAKLYITGNPSNLNNSVKYLGIYLNQSFTDNNDITRLVEFLYTAGK